MSNNIEKVLQILSKYSNVVCKLLIEEQEVHKDLISSFEQTLDICPLSCSVIN